MPPEFDPQVGGCVACADGRYPCDPDMQLNCMRRQQAEASRDQEPFRVPVFETHTPKEHQRRYGPRGVYLSPAEEQSIREQERAAIPLSAVELATIENGLAAEAYGVAGWADVAEALASDNVNLPKHYARFKIEPIRFLIENGANPFQFNIVKYAMREDAKNGLEDIRKIIRYAEMWHDFKAGDPDWWKPRDHADRKAA